MFPDRADRVASTSNQKAVVYNLSDSPSFSVSPIEHTLHAHTRAVTDINWSPHDPDTLATCALDGWVWSWDLRAGRRPNWGVSSFGSKWDVGWLYPGCKAWELIMFLDVRSRRDAGQVEQAGCERDRVGAQQPRARLGQEGESSSTESSHRKRLTSCLPRGVQMGALPVTTIDGHSAKICE